MPRKYKGETFRNAYELKEEAHRIERAEYWDHVKMLASMAKERIDDGGDPGDVVHEIVDGSSYVIYTNESLHVLQYSDNEDAWRDAGAELGENAISVMAFYALEADVLSELNNL